MHLASDGEPGNSGNRIRYPRNKEPQVMEVDGSDEFFLIKKNDFIW